MANSNSKNTPAPVYLSTGIKALNEILAMDIDHAAGSPLQGGFLIGTTDQAPDFETPIILINGETGAGKTTLILQIAFSAAKDSRWLPCFCSLEQSVRSLENVAGSFKKFQDVEAKGKEPNEETEANGRNVKEEENVPNAVNFLDLASEPQKINFCKADQYIYLCHLAPRPISEGGNTNLFEIRLAQLNHILEKIKAVLAAQEPGENKQTSVLPVFFIDSINAFSTETLNRNEIYRLFSLFKNQHVPVVFTMEHHMNYDLGVESDCVQNAKFLSDIVISLTKDSSANYLKYYLEIEKSRVSRQALGRHIYKIRTYKIAKNILDDPRTGIVLYPSIHSVLSSANEQKPVGEEKYFVSKADKDLENIVKVESIKSGECFSIIGPPGTHKLALGMNLAMGYKEKRPASLLVVNFGGSGDFKFDGVAWTESRQEYKYLQMKPVEGREIKFWKTEYGLANHGSIDPILVTTLSFKIGQVTPEECFYMIDKVIAESKNNPLSSVLLSDTAELCNGFPLLTSDPLFLPALIDLFAARKLVTVCIGVDEGQSAKNTDINFSLSSRADYRIVLSHYPAIHELSKQIVASYLITDPESKNPPRLLKEQLVSLVADNVTGKHYGREPRWLYVEESTSGEKKKILRCTPDLPKQAFTML